MSDPLSIAASIGGLAALAGKVCKTLIDYGKAVKDARMDVGILTTELRVLSGMLTNLSLLAASLEASSSNNSFFGEFQLDQLKAMVENLDEKLAKAETKFQASKATSIIQKLKWPFSKDDMMKLVEEVRAQKATINLALSADTLDTLIQGLKVQEVIKLEVESTREAIKVLQEMHSKVQLDEERQKVYDYFLKINPQSQFETAQRLRKSNTGSWFGNHSVVSQWIRQRNSRLWLTGIPGSGKTLLCALLIERVLDICQADTILAFAFCDYKAPETQVLGNVLSSIALQIGLQKPEAFARLQKYYDELHPVSGLPRQVEIAKLTETVTHMCQLFPKVFLIVDGLDECINNTREITRGVAHLASSIPNLSIALFSRREVEISSELVPEYEQIEISAHTQDLELYIDAEIAERPTLCRLPSEESNRIKHTLISKANGMFRWVTCQLDCLEGLGKIGRETALNTLPPTLDESYDRILIKVMSKKGKSVSQEIVRNTLHWVCYDSQGLSIAQICEALSIGLNRDRKGTAKLEMVDEKEIMTYCSSLIRKNLEGDRFELAHFTVEEYLNSIDEESALRLFRYSESDAERSLAQVSLELMLSPEFASRPVAEMSECRRIVQRTADHPFYHYAASHWPAVPSTHDDTTVARLLKELFATRKRPYLLNWLTYRFVHFVPFGDQSDDNTQNKIMDLITFILRRDLTSLHIAAMVCSSALCRWLLATDMDVNATTVLDLAPIHFALLGPDVLQIVAQGLWVNHVSLRFKPGLDSSDDIHATISVFLELDLKVQAVSRHSIGKLALDACVRSGNASPFVALLAVFPNECLALDTLEKIESLFTSQQPKDTLTHDVIQAIFNLDAYANKSAQISGALEFVSKLVRSNSSWDTFDHDEGQFLPVLIQDADFLTFVKYTAQQDRAQDMARLIEDVRFEKHCKRKDYIESDHNPLIIAGACDSAEVATVLLQSGYDKLRVNDNEVTVWHIAARKDSCHVLQALLDFEQDIERRLKAVAHGITPLVEALVHECERAATLLISHCTEDPAFFHSPENPLRYAVAMGSQKLFHELVSKGILLNTASVGNMLPIQYITNRCSDEFVEELIQTYDKDQFSQAGVTAFQSYTRDTMLMSSPILLTDEQLTTRLTKLAPTNHMVNKTQHVWRLFCQDLVCYGNQPWFASHFHNIRRLLLALVDAKIVDSFEKMYKCSSMIALFEEFKALELSAGSDRWEASFLYHACFILRPPSNTMSQPSAITFLMRAIQQNDHPLVNWLIGVHVPVHIRVGDISPIEKACREGSLQIFVEVFQAAQLALGGRCEDADLEILCGLIKTAGNALESEDLAMRKIKFALDQGLSMNKRSTVGSHLGDPAILMAARCNRFDIVKLLIEKGADVFAQASDGWDLTISLIDVDRVDLLRHLHDKIRKTSTYDWKACFPVRFYPPSSPDGMDISNASMLHLAVAGHCVKTIDYLLSNNLVEDVNTCTTELYTPLHFASFLGHVDTITTLVRHGASINGVNDGQKRPIDIALMHEHHEAVETLRALGAGEPSTRPASTVEKSNGDGAETDEVGDDRPDVVKTETTLMPQAIDDCIQDGNLEELQSLFSEDRPMDCPMPTCGVCDVLTYAVHFGECDIVVWLLSIGAIPRQAACSVHRVSGTLHEAVQTSITGVCLGQLLDKALESGYAWSDSPANPLHIACLYDDVEALEVILDHLNANAERYCASISPWKEQDFPSDKAAMVKALTGATTPSDCHQLGEGWEDMFGGVTALHMKAFHSNLPMAMALINAGADVNSLNAEFQTPLIVAVIESDDDCALVEYLLDHGALIDHKDSKGLSAIAHAALNDFIDVARLLVARGASLETRNVKGENVMHLSSVDSLRCFIYFHQQGCDVQAISLYGYTIFGTTDLRLRTYIQNARLIPYITSIDSINLISDSLQKLGTRMTRMLYRSFPRDGRTRLLDSFRDKPPYFSPLCLAISKEELHDALPWLLDEGIDIEREISEEGTAVMYACSIGRLEQVKILVRRGARLDYVDSMGMYHSAILSAKEYPEIIHWLLVERFQDQPKLASNAVVTKWENRSESHHLKGLFSAYRSTSTLP
ncbi:uncharacterized protein FIESC28_05819 [Fusarium coffeatum]|uniref:NACHT domain-containing protein n=1 Tax=Fusarium coffeatum TaxID=231269 RepID=A0A366RP56_9HYPO|nr:uncharacterized protein FIESC28_05819 [Fusarium coffeatum]RBR18897.1 hypothetical protein FIESC28_05819 [Fusarium coffeatum]